MNAAHALLTAAAVRERAGEMLAAGIDDKLSAFRLDMEALAPCADFVTAVNREN